MTKAAARPVSTIRKPSACSFTGTMRMPKPRVSFSSLI